MTRTRTRTLTLVAAAVATLLLAAGCSQKYTAERDGKKLGEAMCDLRNATNAEDAQSARAEIDKQLNDLANKYTLFTAEDRADIQNNLADLAEHAIQGNTALMQQDLAVLERSATNLAETTNETRWAVWEGVLQGLSGCTQ